MSVVATPSSAVPQKQQGTLHAQRQLQQQQRQNAASPTASTTGLILPSLPVGSSLMIHPGTAQKGPTITARTSRQSSSSQPPMDAPPGFGWQLSGSTWLLIVTASASASQIKL
ncbi:MAG: hypothetical protein ACLP7I_12030 [Limisphaerales bacterium]